jgi:hypothetical protein
MVCPNGRRRLSRIVVTTGVSGFHRVRMSLKSKRHVVEGSSTTTRTIILAWVLLGVVALVAYFVLPERKPPESLVTVEYSPRPQHDWERPDFEAARFDERSGDRRRAASEIRGEQATPAGPSKFRIEGSVKAAKSGEAVADVYVVARFHFTEEEQQAFRQEEQAILDKIREGTAKMDDLPVRRKERFREQGDAKGQFVVGLKEAGRYSIEIRRRGYLRAEKVVELTDENPVATLDFDLSRGATIKGRITERENNRPARGLFVYDHPSGQSARSGEDGQYELSGLEPGEHTVTLDLRRHAFSSTGTAPSRSVPVPGPDAEVTGIDFIVEPMGEIWGYVTSAEKDPLAGVDTILATSDSILQQAMQAAVRQAPPLSDKTQKDGYYELVGVPLGREFRVHIMPEKGEPQLSDPFVLSATNRSVRIDFRVRAGSTLYGRVVSLTGEIVENAQVTCIPAYSSFFMPLDTAQAIREERSDKSGNFVIANLPAGSFQLLGQKNGYKIITRGEPVFSDGVTDLHGVEVLLTPVDSGKYRVFGTVSDRGGRAVVSAQVDLTGIDAESLSAGDHHTTTDANGYYEFSGVDAGYMLLHVSGEGYQPNIVNEVKLDEATNVTLRASAAVTGRVLVRETGLPPAEAQSACRVAARPLMTGELQRDALSAIDLIDQFGGGTFVAEDGTFRLFLPEGTYELSATAPKYTPGQTTVTVQEGGTTDCGTLYISQAGGRIEGFVTLLDGKTPAGGSAWISQGGALSMIEQIPGMTDGGGQVSLGADGSFVFERLPQGQYTVVAEVAGYAQGRSAPVLLSENQTAAGVRVTLGMGGTLQGFVMQRGEPKPGSIVTIVGNGVTRVNTADQNGQYRIDAIPEGTYTASALNIDPEQLMQSFSPMQARVDIREGQVTTHNFGDETGATIAGTCKPAPRTGRMGFAVVHMGTPGILGDLRLTDPRSWFEGESPEGALISGMAQIQRDGYFEITNIQPGQYTLDIYYVSFGETLSGNMRVMYSVPLVVEGQEAQNLTISLDGQ